MAECNAVLNSKTIVSDTVENQYVSVSYTLSKRGNVCSLGIELTPKQAISASTGGVTLSGIPKPKSPCYSATYDSNSAGTICGPAEFTSAGSFFAYGARTSGHVYKAHFTYVID